MRNAAAIFGVCLLLGVPASGQDGARPAPWHLKFSHDALETITIPYKDGSSTTVYFMTFTLKNTGKIEARLNLQITATVGTDRRKRKRILAMPHADAEEVVRRGDAWFATVIHDGKTWLRFNILNLHTRERHIRKLVDVVHDVASGMIDQDT